ncbi:MAG TPA: hypothetical protein VFN71_02355 [Methylomirabilota bacterium]|nr:hypothetical protein [Methylomirabilota bacterium]
MVEVLIVATLEPRVRAIEGWGGGEGPSGFADPGSLVSVMTDAHAAF